MRQWLSGLVVASWVMFLGSPSRAADGKGEPGHRDGAGAGAGANAAAGADATTDAGPSAAPAPPQEVGGPLPELPSAAPSYY